MHLLCQVYYEIWIIQSKSGNLATMNRLQRIQNKLKEQLTIVATNPENFEEKWRFTSSRIQLFSFVVILFMVSGILFTLLISTGIFSGFTSKDDASIEREQLEIQHKKIQLLTNKIEAQERYIQNISQIVSGNILLDTVTSDVPEMQKIILPKLDSKATKSEKELARKVKS